MKPIMKRKSPLLAIAISTAITALVSSTAQAQSLNDVSTCFANQVANPATSGISGISTVVMVDNNIVLRRGFGTVAPGSSRAVSATTRFRTGSTLKMMTATSVLSLADQGRISLNSKAVNALPGLNIVGKPGWLDQLTVSRLISHQGGIKDYNALTGPVGNGVLKNFFTDPNQSAVVPFISAPGTFFNYSNSNFMLAGALAENAAGKPYRQVMQDRVFNPLGMSRMTFDAAAVQADGDFAYGISGNTTVGPNNDNSSAFEPAGLAWGSADDLAKFARFLSNGNPAVLSNASWQALRSPQVNTFELLDLEKYGYGVFAYDYVAVNGKYYPAVMRRQHGGSVTGFTADLVTLPSLGFAMVVLGNGNTLDATSCVRTAIAATVGNRLPASAPAPDLGIRRDTFKNFVGWYTENQPSSQATVGPHEITQNAAGDLQIRFPLLDALGIPYERTLIPVFKDAYVYVIQGFGFILRGFREEGATNSATKTIRSRLFVGEKAGYIPNSPTLPNTTAERTAMKNSLLDAIRLNADQIDEALYLNKISTSPK